MGGPSFFGGNQRRFPRARLTDERQLELRPEFSDLVLQAQARLRQPATLDLWLNPSWLEVESDLDRMLRSGAPAPVPNPLAFEPGRGPDQARAGNASDLLAAFMAIPAVQAQMRAAHGEARRQLRLLAREWEGSTHVERSIMITMTALVAGSIVGALLAHDETRALVLGRIYDQAIPVPRVDGLSVRILPRGGQVDTPLGLPGLSGMARVQGHATPGGPTDIRFMINFDLMRYLRSRGLEP